MHPPKPAIWQDPNGINELTPDRLGALAEALKEPEIALTPGPLWVHRARCRVIYDSENDCTCIPIILTTGVTA